MLTRTVFRYSHGFYRFPVLPRNLPFFDTQTDSTRFRYSPGQFFETSKDSTFSRYSPEFYHFLELTEIRPVSGTHRESFSIVAWILPFPLTRPDSTIFRHSHRFEPFPVLVETIFRYSQRFYLFPILARILLFFGTHIDSTIFY